MRELTDRVALVTGGGRGIGRAVALELARRGAHVAVAARSRAEIEAVAVEIRQLGRQSLAHTIDLAEPGASETLVAAVVQGLGSLTILVNNAGIAGPFGATWELSADAWEAALRINLAAPFRLTHAALPQMLRAGWGRVINVSSGAARNPMERAGAYSTSKAALDMLTRQLGSEIEGSGISAIAVHPGLVDTVMQTTIREQPTDVVGAPLSQRFHEFQSSGRLQDPQRPARLIATLAGPAGAELNGQIVDIYSEMAQRLL